MSERERWIVYPLLFLALGAALRDKLFDRTTSKSITSKSIVCQELTVVEEEPTGQQPVRVLARIGRTESVGGLSRGYLFVNGQFELVDEVAPGRPPVRILLAQSGLAPGNLPIGHLLVNGQLNVDGVVNARQYAFQGVPFMPALQAVFPGISPADVLRALQQSLQASPQAAPAENSEQPEEAQPSPPSANQENAEQDQGNAEPSQPE